VTDDGSAEVTASSEQWEGFVQSMESSGNKSLVSLLRNSVLLKLTQDLLKIRFKNTDLFSEAKRKQIEEAAISYFKRSIKVRYEEDGEGIDDSIRKKQEQEQLEKEKEQKNNAKTDARVKQILSVFPGSKISSIEIIKEVEDV
jgi:hypothetical protein